MSILRRPQRAEYLIVGLGNPGEAYARTRHNVGFRCLGLLARRHGLALRRKKARARVAVGAIGGRSVVLARPYTYMNRSGGAVAGLRRWLGLPPERVLVLYDDLDLPLGAVRLRGRGGTAGHKGMRSIAQALGTEEFPRLRLGIGRPADASVDPIDYVLEDFSRAEEAVLAPALEHAADAVECLLEEGLEAAMNRYNRPAPPPAE
jgi:PTH1 family peptidyl-tRNA hydrolase